MANPGDWNSNSASIGRAGFQLGSSPLQLENAQMSIFARCLQATPYDNFAPQNLVWSKIEVEINNSFFSDSMPPAVVDHDKFF